MFLCLVYVSWWISWFPRIVGFSTLLRRAVLFADPPRRYHQHRQIFFRLSFAKAILLDTILDRWGPAEQLATSVDVAIPDAVGVVLLSPQR